MSPEPRCGRGAEIELTDKTRKIVGRGGGKLILLGEHAVVYGQPAVVAGLGKGVTAFALLGQEPTLELIDGSTGRSLARVRRGDDEPLARAFAAILETIAPDARVEVQATVDLPLGVGLGSSAAISAAVARALAKASGKADAFELVEAAVDAAEAVFHGTASGIDQAAALGGGLFIYRRTDGFPEETALHCRPITLLVCKAGKAAPTSEMVSSVAALNSRFPEHTRSIFESIGALAAAAPAALAAGEWDMLGELMNLNHGLLAALGVTTLELDHACHVARDAGALGAKLTGAGGGGCVYAVAPDNEEPVLKAWKERGWRTFRFELP